MLLGRVEGLRRRDHAEECAERVVVLGNGDAADALDVDGVAEAHVAELGDGPAEAVVVDGLRSYYRFDIIRGGVRRDDAAVAEEVDGRVGEELLRVRRRVGVVEPSDAAAELLDAPRAGRDVLLLSIAPWLERRRGARLVRFPVTYVTPIDTET